MADDKEKEDCHTFFWIASHPRSGNTLVRVALSRILLPPEAQRKMETNFPEFFHGKPLPQTGRSFSGSYGKVTFIKTNCCETVASAAGPRLGAIYLVRHPIDVFLSGMHYRYINADKVRAFRDYFGEDGPQPVESLAESGKLDGYLDRFVADRGLYPFPPGSGNWVENVRSWTATIDDGTIIVRFDHLVQDTAGTLWRVLERAGITVAKPRFDFGINQALTATRPNGLFFWRGSTNTRSQFFSQSRITEVETVFRELVGDGYF